MRVGPAAIRFLEALDGLLKGTRVSDGEGSSISLEDGLQRAVEMIAHSCGHGGKALFFGNGGSAANASHMATDYWKLGGLEAMAFNDASLLTCLGNDCGYERVFREPILRFARPGDVAIALSCSGRSPNVLAGVAAARERGCQVITLSGFEPDNPLRASGDLNFYQECRSYGLVEVAQLALLHSMLDGYREARGEYCT